MASDFSAITTPGPTIRTLLSCLRCGASRLNPLLYIAVRECEDRSLSWSTFELRAILLWLTRGIPRAFFLNMPHRCSPVPHFNLIPPGGGLNCKVAGLFTSRPSIRQFGVYLVCLFTADHNAPLRYPDSCPKIWLIVYVTKDCVNKGAVIPLNLTVAGRPIRGCTQLMNLKKATYLSKFCPWSIKISKGYPNYTNIQYLWGEWHTLSPVHETFYHHQDELIPCLTAGRSHN